jgi:NitT/TauT family transport system permease protein
LHSTAPNDGLVVFAAMIVIAVVALIAEWLLNMIEDRLLT